MLQFACAAMGLGEGATWDPVKGAYDGQSVNVSEAGTAKSLVHACFPYSLRYENLFLVYPMTTNS